MSSRLRPLQHLVVPMLVLLPLAACTGLMASPATPASIQSSLTPDSTYRRARAQLVTEVFTIVEEDAAHGWIKATRYRANNAAPNSPLSCRLHLQVNVEGAEVRTVGQWTADAAATSDRGKTTCDQELADARQRVEKFAANVK